MLDCCLLPPTWVVLGYGWLHNRSALLGTCMYCHCLSFLTQAYCYCMSVRSLQHWLLPATTIEEAEFLARADCRGL